MLHFSLRMGWPRVLVALGNSQAQISNIGNGVLVGIADMCSGIFSHVNGGMSDRVHRHADTRRGHLSA